MRGLNASSLALQWNIGLSQYRNTITKINAFKPKILNISITKAFFVIPFFIWPKIPYKMGFLGFLCRKPC